MDSVDTVPFDAARFLDYYEPGAAKIFIRTSIPEISLYPPAFHFKHHPLNYDLYFSKHGLLLYSRHFSSSSGDYGFKYSWNSSGLLISVHRFALPSKRLTEKVDFIYNRRKRLLAEYHRGFNDKSEMCYVYSNLYVYSRPLFYEMIMRENNTILERYLFFQVFDDHNRLVEEKVVSYKNETISWTKYQFSGDTLIRSFELDTGGGIESICEYLPPTGELDSGFRYISLNSSYLREYRHILNNRSHWTACITLDDGLPVLCTERTIEYY